MNLILDQAGYSAMQKSALLSGKNLRLPEAYRRTSSRDAQSAAPLAAMGLGLALTATLLNLPWAALAGLAATALVLIRSRRQGRDADRPCPALQPTVFAGAMENLASGNRR